MNKILKTPAGLDGPDVLSGEFNAVDDDNVCTVPIMTDKDIVEFFQSSTNIMHIDSDYENEMNNVAAAPTSFEMRNVMNVRPSGAHKNVLRAWNRVENPPFSYHISIPHQTYSFDLGEPKTVKS
ncbi:hypothetical protein TNCV_3579231 [Trichonephila clavipes]|nr:hypothetical protein TNCV_3579231 [Trichonephila clavipes]